MPQSQKTLEFLQKLKDKGHWNDDYDYSEVEYKNAHTNIKIICNKHGVFSPKPMSLIKGSDLIITDSGGIQEETTFLGTKCATLRKNTERPVTIESGTNFLVGDDPDKALVKIKKILKDKSAIGVIPDKWDGKSAERIVRILNKSIT